MTTCTHTGVWFYCTTCGEFNAHRIHELLQENERMKRLLADQPTAAPSRAYSLAQQGLMESVSSLQQPSA